jgi:hypothetical protein
MVGSDHDAARARQTSRAKAIRHRSAYAGGRNSGHSELGALSGRPKNPLQHREFRNPQFAPLETYLMVLVNIQ